MLSSNITFILHKPQLSENIGSCARGMKNFNFQTKDLKNYQIIFAVGLETKEALVHLGYKNLVNTNGNLDNLKLGITKYLKHNSRLLHPTYLSQNSQLEKFFQNSNFSNFEGTKFEINQYEN